MKQIIDTIKKRYLITILLYIFLLPALVQAQYLGGSGRGDAMNSDLTDTPLPISLASFEADYINGAVKLNWVTASETENAHFLIYRNDELIDLIAGAGTTTEPQTYAFTDNYVVPGKTYIYVLADVSNSNIEIRHENMAVSITVGEGNAGKDFSVGGAYPNPFNPVTVVPLNLAKEAQVQAVLYNMQGHAVRELIHSNLNAGSHVLCVDGNGLSTGLYFVRVVIDDIVSVQKIALMK